MLLNGANINHSFAFFNPKCFMTWSEIMQLLKTIQWCCNGANQRKKSQNLRRGQYSSPLFHSFAANRHEFSQGEKQTYSNPELHCNREQDGACFNSTDKGATFRISELVGSSVVGKVFPKYRISYMGGLFTF